MGEEQVLFGMGHESWQVAPHRSAVLDPEGLSFDAEQQINGIMMLFDYPDLARFALERAEQRTDRKSIPKELIRRPREEKVATIIRQFDQEPDEQGPTETSVQEPEAESLPVTAAPEEHSAPRRTSKNILSRIARVLRSRK